MRQILVTGGCGFIGSNFINHYHQTHPDVRIVNVDRLDYCASECNIDAPDPSWYSFYRVDITDAIAIRDILRVHKPDVVVHFAAQSHVDNSFGNSLAFTTDNVVGTHTLLECCRTDLPSLERFIHISTDEVYGEVALDHPGCSEQSLLNPTNPYAASKAAAEFLVRSYTHSYGLPAIITRGNNVYGPRQYPEKLIPRFIDLLLQGEPMTVHGKGESRRNFIHVFDVSRAVESILHEGKVGHIYNIGGDCELSVMEVAKKVLELLRPSEQVEDWVRFVPDRPFNDRRYAVQNTALVDLGWVPQISFEEGLQATMAWYREKYAK
jgi:dTDP-glucose 4,6-dehydratase